MNNWQDYSNSYPGFYQEPRIMYVTSLEEALSKCINRNAESIYFRQDLPIFYRIKVDNDGRKYWQEFSYALAEKSGNTPVTQQDLSEINKRLSDIENKLKGGVTDEQPNG